MTVGPSGDTTMGVGSLGLTVTVGDGLGVTVDGDALGPVLLGDSVGVGVAVEVGVAETVTVGEVDGVVLDVEGDGLVEPDADADGDAVDVAAPVTEGVGEAMRSMPAGIGSSPATLHSLFKMGAPAGQFIPAYPGNGGMMSPHGRVG